MSLQSQLTRVLCYYRRNVARQFFKRSLTVRSQQPLISFTFDDFPRSAYLAGGSILSRYGLTGTYYVALGLLGTEGVSGPVCFLDDLKSLLSNGHELGCHTFAHCHSWDTESKAFENSITENRAALHRLLPAADFKTFSYPFSPPRPLSKARVARHFLCCRAGGQALNKGRVDLNQLSAFFLEKSRSDIQSVKDLIDLNRTVRGWLIFATHDISNSPSPFGCTPAFFEEVVRYAIKSDARILTVRKAVQMLSIDIPTGTDRRAA